MLLLASLLCGGAQAASYDPDLRWRTLETEHFHITFHQGEEQLANELGGTAEQIYDDLTEDMGWTPKQRTEIVLVDHTDVANGYATTVPVNTIVIFVTAPQEGSGLALYEDWSQTILTHEFAHILHLDNVQGAPALLRYAFGRIISVNQLSPWWIVEGSATYWETEHTVGGRGHERNPHSDMVIRMSLLEGTFPRIDQMDGLMSGPPGGNTRYLFGQSFLAYVADTTSDDAIERWNATYGGWWLPYVLPAKQVFGETWVDLYDDWRAHLEVRYQDQQQDITARGAMTWPTLVTDADGSCTGPTFAPQGDQLVYACNDRRDGAHIFLADEQGRNPTVEVDLAYAKTFTWRPDGEAFAYSATHVVNDFNTYEDVYFHIVGQEGAIRLTNGQRAKDPAFSPDGSDLMVVKNAAQNNNLARMRIDQTVEPLTDYTDHTQLSTPRWSPDGRSIALSSWRDGTRDLWIFTAEGEPYRRLTMDTHTDRDPAWSADGEWLFFSSDRTGIANIYAVHLETERLYQVTNVLSGAFQPSVRADFELLAWQHYTARGYQIATMPIDPDTWIDQGQLPLPLEHRGSLAALLEDGPIPESVAGTGFSGATGARVAPGLSSVGAAGVMDRPTGGPGLDDVVEIDTDRGEHDREYPFDYPVYDYRPLPTLLPPRYAVPSITWAPGVRLIANVSTGGSDVLRRHMYAVNANYRTDANFFGGGAAYTYNRWRPIMSAGVSRYVVPYGSIHVLGETAPGANVPVVEDTGRTYWDRRHSAWTSVSYSRRQRRYWTVRWNGVLREPKDKLPDTVYEPMLPTRGFLSTVSGSWRFVRARGFAYSISPEDTRYLALTGSVTSSLFGSYVLDDAGERQAFNRAQMVVDYREFVTAPWSANHVWAFNVTAGVSVGDQLQYGSFILGGNYGETPWLNVPTEWKSLRGFPVAADRGDGFYKGSVEYRFPIARLDRGWRTAPVFFKTLHGAAFVDMGDAFFTVDQVAIPRVGAGAELRMTVIAGWGVSFNARVGYAVAVVGGGGYGPLDQGSLYVQLGNSF